MAARSEKAAALPHAGAERSATTRRGLCRTAGDPLWALVAERHCERLCSSAHLERPPGEADRAPMLLEHLLTDGQPQAGALVPCAHVTVDSVG